MGFLRIPESRIASTMSGQLGKSVGGVVASAQSTLFELKDSLQTDVNNYYDSVDKVNSRIASYNSEISSNSKTALDLVQERRAIESSKKDLKSKEAAFNSKLSAASSKISNIEKQISGVSSNVSTIKKLIKSIKIPLKALKATVKVLKALPIPQMYLVVSVTVIYSDLLEMTLELIKQIEELCEALEAVCKQLPAQLDTVKQILSELKTWIATLKLSTILEDLQEEDQKILENAGLLDSKTGESILTKLGRRAGGSNGSASIPLTLMFGECSSAFTGPDNLEKSDRLRKAVGSVEFVNKLAVASPGDQIAVLGVDTGDCVVTYYTEAQDESEDESKKATLNSDRPGEGWTMQPVRGSRNLRAVATISGTTGKVRGNWTVDVIYTEQASDETGDSSNYYLNSVTASKEELSLGFGSIGRTDGSSSYYLNSVTASKEELSLSFAERYYDAVVVDVLDSTKFTNLRGRTGVLKVDAVDDFLGRVATTVDTLPLSGDLRSKLDQYLNDIKKNSDGSENNKKQRTFEYLASTGENYTVEILDDLQYSKLAIRHYAIVKDSAGVVVLEGPKTFSLNTSVLVTDIENRLEQILS